jgi:hypothetical protein
MDENRQVSSGPSEGQQGGASGVSGTLELSDTEGYVGDTIRLEGREFPPGREFDIIWNSIEGDWGVLEANEIIDMQFRSAPELAATVTTDESGAFETGLTVPEDYGGSHTIMVQTGDGEVAARAQFNITPWFTVDEESVPLGETFTLTAYGLGTDIVQSNYQVAWDNGFVGIMTGVMNGGTATAEIRAVGPPGEHAIQVWRNPRGMPFLQNNTQSPYGPVAGGRKSRWTVEVTEPETPPETSAVDFMYDESPIGLHFPEVDEDPEVEFEVTPTSGPPGTSAFVTGEQFPPNTEVELTWYRHEGNPATGEPIEAEPRPEVVPDVTTDDSGRFQVEIEIPRDIGSTRPITAAVDGEEIAVTGFMMQPAIETFEPTSGPAGTEITIELTGVGWTAYEMAPFFLYDNKPLGYMVSADDEGTGIIRTEIQAVGEPGWHFIDAYPTIFQTEQEIPNVEALPHLSHNMNHPVRRLPGFHFAFEITEE